MLATTARPRSGKCTTGPDPCKTSTAESGPGPTHDLDYSVEKVYLHIDDSFTGPGTGITDKAEQYDWRTLEYFCGKGHSIRTVNISISDSASALHESRRKLRAYNIPQADLIGQSLGTNDAGQAIPTATYKTNVKNMIAWKQPATRGPR